MRTPVILLTLLLAFWMAGCSYWYVSQVRGNQVFMFTSISVDDEESGLFHMPRIARMVESESSGKVIKKAVDDPVYLAKKFLKEEGPKTIYFDFACSTTELGEGFHTFIEQLKVFLSEHPGKSITIYGHADSRGPEEANFFCSQERAEFIKSQLVESGIDGMQILIEAMGDDFPVASNDTPEGRKMNRRVEISVPV